jgi:hypothetical protein
LPVEKRMLLLGKSGVLLKGALCDVEIRDLQEAGSLLLADFRAVPWDGEKSVYVGVGKTGLAPGGQYSFSYSVRFLPPSRNDLLRKANRSAGELEYEGSSFQ